MKKFHTKNVVKEIIKKRRYLAFMLLSILAIK